MPSISEWSAPPLTTDARDNIDLQPTATGVPIYWHNGAKLANGYADFWGVTTADGWEGAPKFRDGSAPMPAAVYR